MAGGGSVRVYYRERSERYHSDRRCWSLDRSSGPVFHVDTIGKIIRPEITVSVDRHLTPCKVCVMRQWSPGGGGFQPLRYGRRTLIRGGDVG